MKLKYLLPVATIASIATVATTLVSCGKPEGDDPEVQEIGKWTKGEEYKPMEPKKGDELANADALITSYCSDVKENLDIFSDDFVYFISKGGFATQQQKIKFDINSIEFKTEAVSDIMEFNELGFRVTFSIKLNAGVVYSEDDGKTKHEWTYKDSTIRFADVPVTCNYFEAVQGGETTYIQALGLEVFMSDEKWSIDMPELIEKETKISISDKNRKYTVEDAAELTKAGFTRVFTCLLNYFTNFESNYYQNITVKEFQ